VFKRLGSWVAVGMLCGLALVCVPSLEALTPEEGLRTCAAETDPAKRLSCYDLLATTYGAASHSATPASVTAAPAAAAPVATSTTAAVAVPIAAAAIAAPVAASAAAPAASTSVAAPAAARTTTSVAAAAAAPTTTSTAASSASRDSEFGVSEGPLAAQQHASVPKQITAKVTHVGVRARGELVVTLDNGQVWAQLAPLAYFPLEAGDVVRIKSASLGSYQLIAPSQRATKVTRIQ